MRASAALLAAAALCLPARAAEPPRDLRLGLPATLTITGVALAGTLASVLWKTELAPRQCRICGTNALDARLRDALLWKDTAAASAASDALVAGVPVLAAGTLALSAWRAGGARPAAEDLLVAGQAVSVSILVTQVARYSFGRACPYAWADPSAEHGPNAFLSFWSGHTSAAFATAAAAGTVARLRGYRSWPWILGGGLAGATAVGWMRIAADRHWTTDVLAGAAIGALVGFGLPVWLHGRSGASGAGSGGQRPQSLPFTFSGAF